MKFPVFVKIFCIVRSSVKTYLYVSYFGRVGHTVLFSILRLMMRKKVRHFCYGQFISFQTVLFGESPIDYPS